MVGFLLSQDPGLTQELETHLMDCNIQQACSYRLSFWNPAQYVRSDHSGADGPAVGLDNQQSMLGVHCMRQQDWEGTRFYRTRAAP
jgi:hypothetical protein